MTDHGFKALTHICLNNWHYIGHKVLSFNSGINFFTGHSGSGKSTIIDAMQIVLYANTDGRGFFNKAAADDSDRNLIEYLRGMVNIEENNHFAYLRNENFSTTIVLELTETATGESQCIGVVFDVETASNEISRLFFWHKGALPGHCYRTENRTMTIDEVRTFLKQNFTREESYYGSHNERFRSQLYSIYLGGLDKEKFPLLFKRAIPFKMNIRLEDFVKEYICTEDDIHIEDMQESVMQYGRMKKKIDDTMHEMEELKALHDSFEQVEQADRQRLSDTFLADKLGILAVRGRIKRLFREMDQAKEEADRQEREKKELEERIALQEERGEELLKQIASTGYGDLKEKLKTLNELIEQYTRSEARFQKIAEGLKDWENADCTGNQTLWDMEAFKKQEISEERLKELKTSIESMRSEADEERKEAESEIRRLRREEGEAQASLKELKHGRKAYPKELQNAKTYIQKRFLEEFQKPVQVDILADLLDIKSERWRNAVEGYLGGNKLSLVVEPKYVASAMRFYNELDKRSYFKVAVIDTEQAGKDDHRVLKNALSEEVTAKFSYVQSYVNFMLGRVVKCESMEELRQCRIGITDDCLLYHNYRLQYINPENYTRGAYIGALSVKRRIENLEEELSRIQEEKRPLEETRQACDRILSLEPLSLNISEYMGMFEDLKNLRKKQAEKKRQEQALQELETGQVSQWEKEREELKKEIEKARISLKALQETCWKLDRELQSKKNQSIDLQTQLAKQEKDLQDRNLSGVFHGQQEEEALKAAFLSIPEGFTVHSYALEHPAQCEKLRDTFYERASANEERRESLFKDLEQKRIDYLLRHPGRQFSASERTNEVYDKLLEELSCDRLAEYREKAGEQARTAVEHFKDDFIFKIRSAIREAYNRRDELNKIISSLDFGKDKYRFVIEKNRGDDGKYYDMFMDEALEINPASLNQNMENQMNFFTMEHENRYGVLMNELIDIFIPPDNATAREQEEARRQMEKYADYRTYLSFDMQQIIEAPDGSGETMYIPLSRMIRKNSGGEGQNPFYVALLASFAQAYKINLPDRFRRNTTIRLVVLDEAFSKMDAEKVASCIRLIRGLGFQAIISATNDKIQNYLENVDKTFVFANPGKKYISIQEFEKKQFDELEDQESAAAEEV